MNKKISSSFLMLCCVALLAAGCCKREMVKSEEAPIAPAKAAEVAPTPSPAPVTAPAPEASAVKSENLEETARPVAAAVALQPVYFDFDQYVLSAESREIIKKNADWMKLNAASKIQVQGNCDERGSAEYNLALGENRAKAAVKYLKTLGIPGNRLTYISYGKEKPLDPGHDEAAWTKNRRDDFVAVQ